MLSSVEELRAEFDGSFARPLRQAVDDLEAYVAIQVGERPYALRVLELGGIVVDVPITKVPSRHPALLGLCGIRGAGVPIFDLAQLLGESRKSHALRWIALSAGDAPLGFAFSKFEGYLQVSRREVRDAPSPEAALVGEVLRHAEEYRPVVRIAFAVTSICESESAATGK